MESFFIYFGVASFLAIVMYFIRNKVLNFALFIPFLMLQIGFTIYQITQINVVQLEGTDIYFQVNPLGLIFLSVLGIISLPVILHSFLRSFRQPSASRQNSINNVALVMFITTMTGALLSEHIGLMWAFLEATTICLAILIYHKRSRTTLEATWKYIFVASIGVTLAFLGILFLTYSAHQSGQESLTFSSIAANASKINPSWLKMSFLFIIIGFSVKMGVVPLFTVDIDAKDIAPSPISALISGGLLNVGFVAIFRFYEILAKTEAKVWANHILAIVAMLSILMATVYLLKVKNIKRMLAYSSVEHAGIALLAVSAGGIGYFAAILHLVIHSFVKSSLFFQAGQIQHIFASKSIDKIGGYFNVHTIGGVVFLLGIGSLLAFPPSGLFVSEWLTIQALINQNQIWLVVIMILLLTFVMFAMGKATYQILFQPLPEDGKISGKLSGYETATQWILLSLAIWIGIFPPEFLKEFIGLALKNLVNVDALLAM
jgi:hydrogenase-4 component F